MSSSWSFSMFLTYLNVSTFAFPWSCFQGWRCTIHENWVESGSNLQCYFISSLGETLPLTNLCWSWKYLSILSFYSVLNALISVFHYVVQCRQWYTLWDAVQDAMLPGAILKLKEDPFIFRNIHLKRKNTMAVKFNPFTIWLDFSGSYFTWNEALK